MTDVTPNDVDRELQEIKFSALPLRQPLGEIYAIQMDFRTIRRISDFDVRRIDREQRNFESYLGVQRPLNVKRSREIGDYTNFSDATFPGAIILAVDEGYAEYLPDEKVVVIRNHKKGEASPSKAMRDIARVLDGQHRIAGLEFFRGENFDVLVSLFIGADMADQAYIFATVNLEQKKVNRSLAFDLFDWSQARSPERTCHNIAVTFDQDEGGPFFKRIKRLGSATPGRDHETITQATFVDGLLAHISRTPKHDRDLLRRNKRIPRPSPSEIAQTPLRLMFAEDRDLDLAKTYFNYFSAVAARWPTAWATREQGLMLNRTNGYNALARLFRPAFLAHSTGEEVVSRDQFAALFAGCELADRDFTVDRFPPGSSGESALFRELLEQTHLGA